MDTEDLIRLNLEISANNADDDELDGMARRLLVELRDTDVESAKLATGGPVPAGAKSAEAITTGTILLTVLPAALPKLIDFIQSWSTRTPGRAVKFKGIVGRQAIEFEGSAQDLQNLLQMLQKGKTK